MSSCASGGRLTHRSIASYASSPFRSESNSSSRYTLMTRSQVSPSSPDYTRLGGALRGANGRGERAGGACNLVIRSGAESEQEPFTIRALHALRRNRQHSQSVYQRVCNAHIVKMDGPDDGHMQAGLRGANAESDGKLPGKDVEHDPSSAFVDAGHSSHVLAKMPLGDKVRDDSLKVR